MKKHEKLFLLGLSISSLLALSGFAILSALSGIIFFTASWRKASEERVAEEIKAREDAENEKKELVRKEFEMSKLCLATKDWAKFFELGGRVRGSPGKLGGMDIFPEIEYDGETYGFDGIFSGIVDKKFILIGKLTYTTPSS